MADKQKILIVDDDNNIAELIALYLAKELYDTRIVNDGEEALKVFPVYQPDLVLLDLMLPGIDGYQVCRTIRTTSQVTAAANAASLPGTSGQSGKYVEYPGLVVNLTNYSVIYDGHSVDMPPKELELLYFLASQPNQVFNREQLLDHIWGYEYAGDTRTVDVHIKRLREKIKDHPTWALTTVWGVGYKFEVRQ